MFIRQRPHSQAELLSRSLLSSAVTEKDCSSPRDGRYYAITQTYLPPQIPTSVSVQLMSIENLAPTMACIKDFHLLLGGPSHNPGSCFPHFRTKEAGPWEGETAEQAPWVPQRSRQH